MCSSASRQKGEQQHRPYRERRNVAQEHAAGALHERRRTAKFGVEQCAVESPTREYAGGTVGRHADHREPAEFMNAGTGRAAARSQSAMALTTEPTAGRLVMRSRHSRSVGVATVTGAL